MKAPTTRIRSLYMMRYAFRLCVLVFTIIMCFVAADSFSTLSGLAFLHDFSWLHVLWIIWVVDMVSRLVPNQRFLALGSLKHLKIHYRPAKASIDRERIKRFFRRSSIDSLKVLIAWVAAVALIGVLRAIDFLGDMHLLLISVVLYVLDLTFVLFWCPLRACILKNRCCTTCRIFNWDHLMMFSPLLFISGFYGLSLVGVALVLFLIWEVSFVLHPERFCEDTNAALRCNNCSDKLCGQHALPSS